MIIKDLSFIKQNISKNQKILSLDVSKNNIGIAVSDCQLTLAFPLKTLKRSMFIKDIILLKNLIKSENAFAIIVGYPLDGDGKGNHKTQSVTDFAKEILKHIDIPIFFQDERFSTNIIANRVIKGNQKDVDSQAAAWFLQIFLDKLSLL